MIAWLAAVALAQSTAVYVPDATWAAEDLDAASDEDQNDLVLRYNARCVVDDVTGDLRRIDLRFTPAALGASKTNALLLRFPAVPTAVAWSVDGAAPVVLCDAGTPCTADVELYADARDAFDAAPTGFVNTDGGAWVRGREHALVADFAPGLGGGMTCPLPGFALDRADLSAPIDRTRTLPANGQPLVGDFPDFCASAPCPPGAVVPWAPPAEHTAVSDAYPDFTTWLDDRNGEPPCTPGVDCAAEDWFENPGAEVLDPAALATAAVLGPAPTCTDGAANAEETDVDCGGAVCDACGAGDSCAVDGDCASGWCNAGTCAALAGSGANGDPYITSPLLSSCKALETWWGGAEPLQTGSYRVDVSGTTRHMYCDFEHHYEVTQEAVNLDLTGTRAFCTSRGEVLAIPTSSEIAQAIQTFLDAFDGNVHGIRFDMDIKISGDCNSTLYARSSAGAYRTVTEYALPGGAQCSATYHDYILGCQARPGAGGLYSAVQSGYHGGSDHRSWTQYCTSASTGACTGWAPASQGPMAVCTW